MMPGWSLPAGFAFAPAEPRVSGSFLVGAVFAEPPRELPPRPDVLEARPFDLVLVAMHTTLRPTDDRHRQDAASVRDQPSPSRTVSTTSRMESMTSSGLYM